MIVNLNGDTVTVNTDLTDPNQQVSVDRKQVMSIEPSKVSLMPPGLLNLLTKDESRPARLRPERRRSEEPSLRRPLNGAGRPAKFFF